LQVRPRPPGAAPAPGRGAGPGGAPGAGRGPADPSAGAAFRATPVSNLILYAFDAETGKTLYSSDKVISNWTHFSEPVVALGKVFVVTHDGHVYAFGL
jgi:outer membrane protein assembly factor BamB